MSISIGSNLASLNAQRRLSDGTRELSTVFERLSSGLRINKASDDAAGLSISDSLRADRRVFNQGVRNFNDGLSLLTIADSAIESLSNIVIRLKELAEQSANGVYSPTQRAALDKEAQALSKEYTRIAQSTTLNSKNILNGSLGTLRVQGGYGTDGGIASGIGGAIASGTFAAAVTIAYTSTTSFAEVSFADLNGDGNSDFVATDRTGGNRYMLVGLGNGDGTFSQLVSMAETHDMYSSELADLNNDGFVDSIASNSANRLRVRMGNGDGTFGSVVSYAISGIGMDIVSGDINGDGNIDFVSGLQNTIAISLGSGNGTLTQVSSYTFGDSTAKVALVDLNNDGKLDLLGAGQSLGPTGLVGVRLGNGDGTFQSFVTANYGTPVIDYADDGTTSDIVTGDFNGDGRLDMITSGSNYAYSQSSFQILLGNGDGTFQTGTRVSSSAVTTYPGALASGDMNGDGHLDFVAQNTIYLGYGNGTFASPITFTSGTSQETTRVEDFNNDGVLDIGSSGSGGLKFVLSGTKEGTSALLPFSLSNAAESKEALGEFSEKLNQLSAQRGKIGAFQARLEVGINTLQSSSENYAAAESRIRSADIADESSKLVSLNILQKAASSVLAQANLQPEIALKLLQK